MARISVAAFILVSGCSVVQVDERPMDGSLGAVELKAIKRDDPDELTSGYAFRVKGRRFKSGWVSAESTGPVLLPGLRPGSYTVEVRGKGISPKRFEIDVRPGVRTSIAVLRKNVKRNERIAEKAEAVAVAAGKAVLYTVGFVGYVIIVLPVQACLEGDSDDEDDEDDCRAAKRSADPAPKGYRSVAPSGYRRQ